MDIATKADGAPRPVGLSLCLLICLSALLKISAGLVGDLSFTDTAGSITTIGPGKLTTYGTPTLYDSTIGKELKLINNSQYAVFTFNEVGCAKKFEDCGNVTIGFWLRTEYGLPSDNTLRYVLDLGDPQENGTGLMTVYLEGRNIVAIMHLEEDDLSVIYEIENLQEFLLIEVSWDISKQNLALYIGRKLVKMSTISADISTTFAPLSGTVALSIGNSLNPNNDFITKDELQIGIGNIQIYNQSFENALLEPATPIVPIPELQMSFISSSNFQLECSTPPSLDKWIHFEVSWFVNGAVKEVQSLESGNSTSVLALTMADFKHSVPKFMCSMKACLATLCSDQVNSDVYLLDITLSESSVTIVEEGDTQTVYVKLSEPPLVLCGVLGYDDYCKVQIASKLSDSDAPSCFNENQLPQVYFQTNFKPPFCSMTVTPDNNASVAIPLKASSDGVLDGTRLSVLTVDLLINNVVMEQFTKTVQLTVEDNTKPAVCKALAGRYITSFDDRYGRLPISGEFVFYKDKTLPIEVRAFSNYCSSDQPCICAIGVRVHDLVIMMDRCGSDVKVTGSEVTTLQMYTSPKKTYGTKLLRLPNNEFKIILPTGASIVTKMNDVNLFNIWLYNGKDDNNQTEGLCGDFDEQSVNEDILNIQHFLKWRVSPGNSIYRGYCPKSREESDNGLTENHYFDCSDAQMQFFPYSMCTGAEESDITGLLMAESKIPENCHSIEATIADQFKYNATVPNSLEVDWVAPWDNVIAKSYCEGFVSDSGLAEICDGIVPAIQTDEIRACMEEIRLTGDAVNSVLLIEGLEERCVRNLLVNLTLRSLGQYDTVLAIICSRRCSQHGSCVRGICHCEDGFIGDSCSIPVNTPPELVSLTNDGLCNTRVEDCTSVTVYGRGFVQSDQLACYVTQSQGEPQTMKATFITSTQVCCSLPTVGPLKQFVITVNDPDSPGLFFFVFDPVCWSCDRVTEKCLQKESCVIEGDCWYPGAVNPANQKQTCMPDVSQTKWTTVSDLCLVRGGIPVWNDVSNAGIGFHNQDTLSNTNQSECRQACLDEDTFLCQSYEYNDVERLCHLSQFRKTDVGAYFSAFPKDWTFSEWTCSEDSCTDQNLVWSSDEEDSVPTFITDYDIYRDYWTADQCKLWCEISIDCGHISYNPHTGVCVILPMNISDERTFTPGWRTYSWSCQDGNPGDRNSFVIENPVVQVSFNSPETDQITCVFDLPNEPVQADVLMRIDNITVSESKKSFSGELVYQHLLENMTENTEVVCAVSICDPNNCELTRAPLVQSEPYKAELKITAPSYMELFEGQDGELISIQASAPPRVLCQGKQLTDSDVCEIRITLTITNSKGNNLRCPSGEEIFQIGTEWISTNEIRSSYDPSSIIGPFCGVYLTNTNWQEVFKIPVKAMTDNKYDGDQQIEIGIYVEYIINGTTTEMEKRQTVKVDVRDMDRPAICSSVNDPLIKTFDNRTFHNYYEGEFVFMRHLTLPYEVRTFYRICDKRLPCVCAVAAKVEDDVVLLDMCGDKETEETDFTPLKVFMYRNNKVSSGLKIYSEENGGRFKIIFPSGTVLLVKPSVRVKTPTDFLNVWLKPSASDFNQTVGLCGTFDDDPMNDLQRPDGTLHTDPLDQSNSYSVTWRVETKEETYYTGVCASPDTPREELLSMPSSTYCLCNSSGTVECRKGKSVQHCNSFLKGADITERIIKESNFPVKCAPNVTSSSQFPMFEYDTGYVEETTESGIPIDQVTCDYLLLESKFYSATVSACRTIPYVDYYGARTSCIEHVKFTSSVDWLETTVDNIFEQCLIQLHYNVDQWIDNPGSMFAGPPIHITDLFCPGYCKQAGDCRQGSCECKAGQVGLDCSLDEAAPPQILSPLTTHICDHRSEDCSTINVFLLNIDTDPVCNFTKVKIDSMGYTVIEDPITQAGHLISFNEIVCDLPPNDIDSYIVTISNKGRLLSDSFLSIVFDSACFICSALHQNCSQKLSGCLVDGVCYEDGEFHKTDFRHFCDPSKSFTELQLINDTCQGLDIEWFSQTDTNLIMVSNIDTINGTILECRDACLNIDDPPCLSFNFDLDTQSCSLLAGNKRSRNSDTISSNKSVYYEWRCNNNPCGSRGLVWITKPGFAFTRYQLRIESVTSRANCQLLCLQQTMFLCKSAIYFPSGGTCFLSATRDSQDADLLVKWRGIVYLEWQCVTGNGFPIVEQNPTAVFDQNGDLTCSFPRLEPTSTDYRYQIEFTLGMMILGEHLVFGNQVAYLNSDLLPTLTFGTQLGCAVAACADSQCDETGAIRKSSDLDVKIQLKGSPSMIRVFEGATAEYLTISSSVPPYVLCSQPRANNSCLIKVSTTFSDDTATIKCPSSGDTIPQIAIGSTNHNDLGDFCGTVIHNENWFSDVKVPLKAVLDMKYDEDVTGMLKVEAVVLENSVSVAQESLGNVLIEAINRDSRSTCTSGILSQTFDGLSFQSAVEGEFVLYRHMEMSLSVHIFYKACNGRPSCVCALAVNTDVGVTLFDACGPMSKADGDFQPIRLEHYQVFPQVHPRLQITRFGSGLKYGVMLPTGTEIFILLTGYSGNNGLQVIIKASPIDLGQTQGLCGHFDGDLSNEFEQVSPEVALEQFRLTLRNGNDIVPVLQSRVPFEVDVDYMGLNKLQNSVCRKYIICDKLPGYVTRYMIG